MENSSFVLLSEFLRFDITYLIETQAMVLVLRTLSSSPAMKKILQDLLSRGDVWMIRVKHVIEWIKSPTSLNDIENFAPWKCDSKPPPPACSTPNVCSFSDDPHYL